MKPKESPAMPPAPSPPPPCLVLWWAGADWTVAARGSVDDDDGLSALGCRAAFGWKNAYACGEIAIGPSLTRPCSRTSALETESSDRMTKIRNEAIGVGVEGSRVTGFAHSVCVWRSGVLSVSVLCFFGGLELCFYRW